MPWFSNRARLAGLVCLTVGQLLIILPAVSGSPSLRSAINSGQANLNQHPLRPSLNTKNQSLKQISGAVENRLIELRPGNSGNALSGGSCGGGGGVIYINNQPRLVDFYTIPSSYELLSEKYSSQEPSFIKSALSMTFDANTEIKNPALKMVLEIFRRWSDLPYDSIGLWINTAIFKPVWNFTDESLLAPPSYRPSPISNDDKIETAAYYLQKENTYNVNISRDIWNLLSIQDQVGLLIHETLRHVQIGFSFGFDDEALQKATAMMMICRPRVKFDQYLFYLLNNRRDLAELKFESFEQLTKECWK